MFSREEGWGLERFILGSRYYFSRLSPADQQIYRQLYDAWCDGGNEASVRLRGTGFALPSGLDLCQIVDFIIKDNPHLFHLEGTQVQYQRLGRTVTVSVDSAYTPSEYRETYRLLQAAVDGIVHAARRYPSELERLRFLHDTLADSITYSGSFTDRRSAREVHTIAGALLRHRCVCDGYSRAFRLLCDLLHISCIVISGSSTALNSPGPHAWNIVKFGGHVYHADITWDSCYRASPAGSIADFYFLRSDQVFSRDHSWDRSFFPPAAQDYPRTGRLVRSPAELEQYLSRACRSGKKQVLVDFPDSRFPSRDALNSLLQKAALKSRLTGRGFRHTSFTYCEECRCAQINFC